MNYAASDYFPVVLHNSEVSVRISDLILSYFAGTAQVRLYHTDLKVPDFSNYRRDGGKQANRKDDSAEARKAFTYLLAGSKDSIIRPNRPDTDTLLYRHLHGNCVWRQGHRDTVHYVDERLC